ncbi:MAG: 3'-5' exonuclease [Myxococcota bacterium]|nr:3'-5' exonuclease [Myxococcota bacterium]
MARATWFCIDIECSGTVPGLFDMISLGAQVVYEREGGSLALGPQLYLEMKPQAPKVDARAMAVNGLDLERLRRDGMTRRDAMLALTDWVQEHATPGSEAVFVGHNAPFDWSFVSYAYKAEELDNPFGYKALDTKALAAGVLDLHWLDTGKETLAERLGLPAEDMGQKHRADYDAWYQALVLKGLLEFQRGQSAPADTSTHVPV